MEKNYFQELNDIDVSKYVEKKQGLTYLSWSYAWTEAKKRYPDMQDKIYECVVDDRGNTVNYFTDGRTCWVKVGVTINGIEHIVELPVMDLKNKSIPLDQVTSMDVNKAIQRCTTKAIAKHGLGLYIYAGEDLPEANRTEMEELSKKIKQIVDLGSKLIKAGVAKEMIANTVAEHNDGVANPAEIKTMEVCDAVIEALNTLKPKK